MRQVIIGGQERDLGVVPPGPEYNVLCGCRGSWTSIQEQATQVVSTPGTISSLKVRVAGAPPGVDWATFTLMVNGIPTALTCTVTGASTDAEDNLNVVNVVAGDFISLRGSYSVGLLRNFIWSAKFTGDNPIILGCSDFISMILGLTRYIQVQGSGFRGSENDHIQIVPAKGVIKNLYVRCVPVGAGVWSVRNTLRVNGADTPLTCDITNPATTGSDTANEVAVNPGDRICLKMESLVNGIATYHNFGMTFIPDVVTEPIGGGLVLGGDNTTIFSGGPSYHCSGVDGGLAQEAWNSTEVARHQLAQSCRLKNLYVRQNIAPGAGFSHTYTVRVNGAPTALSCVISDLAIEGNNTTHTIDISDWDVVSLEGSPSAPGASNVEAHWGILMDRGLPVVTTDPATDVEPTSATQNGTLGDDGGEACNCGFEWGLTAAYGNTTPTQSKTTGQSFSWGISGLSPSTLYHFRAFATNGAGTSCGADRTFTTDALPPAVIAPDVTTNPATGII